MDRNTIIGMVLMCAVIFGFMWLSKPSDQQIAEQKRQAEEARKEQVVAQRHAAANAVDTLTADEYGQLKSTLQSLSADSASGIKGNGIKLAMNGSSVTGTVAAGDTTLDFDDVMSHTPANVKAHNLAVAAVKKMLETYTKNGSFASSLSGTNKTIALKNDLLNIEVSTKGGTITRAQLTHYNAFNAPHVELFTPGENEYSFTLLTNTQRFETKDFYFTPKQLNDSTLLMQLDLGNGAKWGLKYTLVPGSYMVRMEVVQENMQKVIPANIPNMDFTWHQKMSRHEEGKMFEERNSAIYYKYAGESGDVDHLKESGNSDKDTQDRLKWISTKNQFFSVVLISDKDFIGAQMKSTSFDKDSKDYDKYLKDMTINSSVEYSSTNPKPASFYFYFGPNKYPVLSSYDKYSPKEDLKLTQLIPLGWKLFRWINTGIIIPVFNWLGHSIANYGIIILILTLLIKLVLSPLTYKSYMSQAKMRILAPDIKEINDKYPGQENAMKRQQKTMALYSLAGASPFGGCLPMLLQMPILIAMFTFFPSCIELRGEAFLWAKDLSAPDAIVSWTAQIPFITNYFGNHISLFCMLMTVTNIVYTYLTMQSQSQSSSMPGMKWMMYLMPLMFLVFFNNYASGLSYYYFISLLITIAQTYSCRLFVNEAKVRAKMAENEKKPKKKSGFMARLEEAQRMQQAQQQGKGSGKKRR